MHRAGEDGRSKGGGGSLAGGLMSATPGGLLIPTGPGSRPPAENPAARYAHTYLTYEELVGKTITEDEIIGKLGGMSAYDVLNSIAHLSCMVSTAPFMDRGRQSRIMEALR